MRTSAESSSSHPSTTCSSTYARRSSTSSTWGPATSCSTGPGWWRRSRLAAGSGSSSSPSSRANPAPGGSSRRGRRRTSSRSRSKSTGSRTTRSWSGTRKCMGAGPRSADALGRPTLKFIPPTSDSVPIPMTVLGVDTIAIVVSDPRKAIAWNRASGSASSRIRTGTCSTSSSRSPPRNGRPRSLPRSPAPVVGSDRLRSPTRFQAQRTIGARGGFVESPELREDEAHVHPRAPVTRIDLEGALVASERLVELPEARERVPLVVPRDLVGRVHLDRRVEATQRVDETTELRERVPLVQPGDLIVRVDVKRPVDGAKRLIVPAEEDERGPFAIPGHLCPRDARARRRDRAIVVRERLFVVFAPHIPLRSDELPPKYRRRVPAEDFRGRQGCGPRHRRTDTRDPWEADRVRGIGDRRDGLTNDGNCTPNG